LAFAAGWRWQAFQRDLVLDAVAEDFLLLVECGFGTAT
jgi:hypothetical protein